MCVFADARVLGEGGQVLVKSVFTNFALGALTGVFPRKRNLATRSLCASSQFARELVVQVQLSFLLSGLVSRSLSILPEP